MSNTMTSLKLGVERLFARLGLGMRAKLITLFVFIKVVPLVLLALLAWNQAWELGEELKRRTAEIAGKANRALSETGEIAVNDAVKALDARATEDIERMSTDTARRVAEFLYARDQDILLASKLESTEVEYRDFVEKRQGRLIRQSRWELAADGKSWKRADKAPVSEDVHSSIAENNYSFHYRPPEPYQYEEKPLYREMTFIDLNGHERIKVTTSPLMNPKLLDVSDRRNTYVRAETYFPQIKKLKPGEIYVSDVIGEYVGSRVIGMYTPENAAKVGEDFRPEESAYAGAENPLGKRFKGIVRWAAPVVKEGRIIGYVTLALDHDHIMEFTAHITPTRARYTEIPDASEGNYAFIWDYKGRSIVHPRHFSITGYDAETGDPQVPWLEDRIYDQWQASGKSYADFIEDVPTFVEQSNSKKPAPALTKKGLIGLDCRYLNFAPQCTGWFDLTKNGGSGSFLILWSGLWKLNTAAAIPYYTGHYGESKRGFGFVAIGAGVVDFHRPATETQKVIDKLIASTDQELAATSRETHQAIGRNLLETAMSLSASTLAMVALVILIAIWMASVFTRSIKNLIEGITRFRSGERHFRFHAEIKDEMGALADCFDEMADSLVDSVKGFLVITDLDKKILYANPEALELVGYTFDEARGKFYDEISIYPADSVWHPIKALLEGREAEVFHHAGTDKYYKGQASYLTDKDGKNIGYIVSSTDVSDIIAEQKSREEQRVLLDSIFSSSPDIMWYQDQDGRYLAVNPRFASMAGRNPDQIVGRTVDDVLPPDMAAQLKKNDLLALCGHVPLYAEEELRFADGHEEVVDAVRRPMFNSRGELVGVLGVARDVSRRAAAEAELRATQLELERAAAAANRASESKSNFLARMSHEIRTPMNAIIGMTNITKRKLTEDPPADAELLNHVRQIEVSSTHLLGLLNDILDISKIEAGKIELTAEAFDLNKMAANVGSIIRPRCQEKNIEFEVRVEQLEKSRFLCDALRLRQVLINLLGNAVKFTPECGKILFLVRQIERRDNATLVYFSVSDTGIGISEQGLAMLFTPFEQGGGHISKTYGGTGLGLSISKSIVKLLGGDIHVSSIEGKGSEFSFSIWLNEDESEDSAATPLDDVSALKGKRLLLVDDVFVNRLIVIEQLSPTGLLIDEAEDGEEALEMFVASPVGHYDMILMDVQMPRMDGHQASRAIRSLDRPDAGSVPIIAMTANAFKEDVEQALAHGMNGHLAKPLENEKLMEILLTLLNAPKGHH